MNPAALWRAMLYAMDNPAECGPKVNGVTMRDTMRYMQRTRHLLGMPGSPTVTDNFRVTEGAQEITYRPVINNVDPRERVSTLRTDPLRPELVCHHSRDERQHPGH